MASNEDVFGSFESTIRDRVSSTPWSVGDATGSRVYLPDYDLLASLVDIPLAASSGSESGRLAKAIDAWMAHELRRSGFGDDEVWPRLTQPRVLPRDLALFVQGLPARDRAYALPSARLASFSVARVQHRHAGSLRPCQPHAGSAACIHEPPIETAKNLRGRFPLISMGFLFLLRSTVLHEPGTLDRAVDMLRKLQQDVDGYDATCLVIAEWIDPPAASGVQIRNDLIPDDLRADRFIATLIDRVLERTPIDMHVEVREGRQQRPLPVDEVEEAGEDP